MGPIGGSPPGGVADVAESRDGTAAASAAAAQCCYSHRPSSRPPPSAHGQPWVGLAEQRARKLRGLPHMPTKTLRSSKWKLWTEVPTRPGNPRRAARGTPIPRSPAGPRFPIPAESRIGGSLPVSRPNREWGERELGTSGSGRHPPSDSRPVLGSLRRNSGGGRNLHLKDSRQHSAQDRACCTHTRRVPPISRFAAYRETGVLDSRFRPSRESWGLHCPAKFPRHSGLSAADPRRRARRSFRFGRTFKLLRRCQ
jgi:hypothetical protein